MKDENLPGGEDLCRVNFYLASISEGQFDPLLREHPLPFQEKIANESGEDLIRLVGTRRIAIRNFGVSYGNSEFPYWSFLFSFAAAILGIRILSTKSFTPIAFQSWAAFS